MKRTAIRCGPHMRSADSGTYLHDTTIPRCQRTLFPASKDQYYNAGVAFKPKPSIDLALVYKHEKVTDGTVSISGADGNASYTIGGTGVAHTGTKTSGQFNEVGIYTQYVF